MPLRNFIDRNGEGWCVWSVVPQASGGAGVPPALRRGWLCFAPERGEQRFRLPLEEVPTGWDALPDDRLDLLRQQYGLTSRLHKHHRIAVGNMGRRRGDRRQPFVQTAVRRRWSTLGASRRGGLTIVSP